MGLLRWFAISTFSRRTPRAFESSKLPFHLSVSRFQNRFKFDLAQDVPLQVFVPARGVKGGLKVLPNVMMLGLLASWLLNLDDEDMGCGFEVNKLVSHATLVLPLAAAGLRPMRARADLHAPASSRTPIVNTSSSLLSSKHS